MTSSALLTLEIAMPMTCSGCGESVKQALQNSDLRFVSYDVSQQKIVIETSLAVNEVLKTIENKTSKPAALIGISSSQFKSKAAVSAIETGKCRGVARFIEMPNNQCLVDATFTNLNPKSETFLAIHSFGDLSDENCETCGPIFKPENDESCKKIVTDENGACNFRGEMNVDISEIIGRSLVVQDKNPIFSKITQRFGCGIIARSSGLFENSKRLCACDGVTVWDERNVAQTGSTRSNIPTSS